MIWKLQSRQKRERERKKKQNIFKQFLFFQVLCELSGCSEEVADKGKSVESAGGGGGGRRRVKLATIIMKHKKEKNKEKSKKKSGSSRASSILTTMQRHRQQSSQGVGGGGTGSSTGAASSAALLDQAALQSAYRWEKLSPAEFEQLQDLAACKEFFYFIYFIKNIFPTLQFYFVLFFLFFSLKNNRVWWSVAWGNLTVCASFVLRFLFCNNIGVCKFFVAFRVGWILFLRRGEKRENNKINQKIKRQLTVLLSYGTGLEHCGKIFSSAYQSLAAKKKKKKKVFIGWHIVSLLFDRISWYFKIISQPLDRTRTTPWKPSLSIM